MKILEWKVFESTLIPGQWHVEANGDANTTIFDGPDAEIRARTQAEFLTSEQFLRVREGLTKAVLAYDFGETMKKLILISALLLICVGCIKNKRTCQDKQGNPVPCFGSLR